MSNVSIWSNVAISIESSLGSPKTISAITKADPAVASSTAHGISDGSFVKLAINGMYQLDNRVVRTDNAVTDAFALEGVDSSSYATFSSGTASVITFGTTLGSISEVNVSGGEFSTIDVSTIHENLQREIPGVASPIKVSLTANWDASNAALLDLQLASQTKSRRAVKFTFADGQIWVFDAYIGCTLSPNGQAGQKVTTPIVLTLAGLPMVYA